MFLDWIHLTIECMGLLQLICYMKPNIRTEKALLSNKDLIAYLLIREIRKRINITIPIDRRPKKSWLEQLQLWRRNGSKGPILDVYDDDYDTNRNPMDNAQYINPLKTKRRLLYLKAQSIPRCKHFSSRLWNQSVYAVSGTSRCLFSDKYKTHK